jgi:branched-chain amino acid transport system ATP-binding protein
MSLLEVEELSVKYGLVLAVDRVSLRVDEGELVALVGANGAGKTSTLLGISGVLDGCTGTVVLDGVRLDTRPPQEVAAAGVVHVPEGRQLFPEMTVQENLDLGAFLPVARRRRRTSLSEALELMPQLRDRLGQRAESLSGGEQQMVAIARGLMASPRLLILDEPTLGLAPLYVKAVFETIEAIRERGTAILLVEQNVNHALRIANRAYVMQAGELVMSGSAKEVLNDTALTGAILGSA